MTEILRLNKAKIAFWNFWRQTTFRKKIEDQYLAPVLRINGLILIFPKRSEELFMRSKKAKLLHSINQFISGFFELCKLKYHTVYLKTW